MGELVERAGSAVEQAGAGTDVGVSAPQLPPGRTVDLPGRGRTFVREAAGPAGAPTLLLLHRWTVTADLNWFTAYEPLSRHFRVIALDHRGHGQGIRSWKPFRLEDCADDDAALAQVLGIDRLIPVGYSMGGPVAQLLWRRHRHRQLRLAEAIPEAEVVTVEGDHGSCVTDADLFVPGLLEACRGVAALATPRSC
ncbi:MAG TPA: alpha/beta fold hydrolase [Acidimicrobiales bacterium]|nr:alpha/beta fold hydrolase [Acidimicrobiales bacterium]